MDARRSSTARPASESPRGRKPRAAAKRYGDFSGRAAAAVGGFRLFWGTAGRMLGVPEKPGSEGSRAVLNRQMLSRANQDPAARRWGRQSKTASPISTADRSS